MDKKVICCIMICIIILSAILINKISAEKKYDEKLYDEIYSEYNEIFENNKYTASDNKELKKKSNNIVSNTENYKMKIQRNKVIASIMIPDLSIVYPVIDEATDEYLKIAPCKIFGGKPNQIGNLSIIGHNYKTEEFFSKLNTLENGDRVILSDKEGTSLTYKIYDKYEVASNDFSCIEESPIDKIELTLITCTNNKSKRLVVKCIANV